METQFDDLKLQTLNLRAAAADLFIYSLIYFWEQAVGENEGGNKMAAASSNPSSSFPPPTFHLTKFTLNQSQFLFFFK